MSSKLVDLLTGTKYARLDRLSANNGTNKSFSVRNQSDPAGRQTNAVNFFGSLAGSAEEGTLILTDTIQKEFTVGEASNTLSVTGIAKSPETNYTTFTSVALGTHATRNVDSKLTTLRGVPNLLQRYLATDTSKQFANLNSTTQGIKLMYNPA